MGLVSGWVENLELCDIGRLSEGLRARVSDKGVDGGLVIDIFFVLCTWFGRLLG